MNQTPPPIPHEREAIELERLRVELKQLKRSAWINPPVVFSVIAVLTSLFGAYQQHQNTKIEKDNTEKRFILERSKWEAELERITKLDDVNEAERAGLRKELEEIRSNITTVDGYILKNQLQIMTEQIKVGTAEALGSAVSVAGAKKILEFSTSREEMLVGQKREFEARRKELEGQLYK